VDVQGRRDAAGDAPLALLEQDLGLSLALVDRGRAPQGRAEDDVLAPRVVLDNHLHLDLADVAFANDGRHDVEIEQGFLELVLSARGADRRVRALFHDGDWRRLVYS